MITLPSEAIADIHILRQDHARALAAFEAHPSPEHEAAWIEQRQRRARAIRMIRDEDNPSIRQLAAMFRCSKVVIREALAAGPEED